ncbi:MAG: hypothetical protein OXT67_09540 [Zetaproteobacteria bacterium]|nr:hypothetical protein [Zetaproteobacteria bacterium]
MGCKKSSKRKKSSRNSSLDVSPQNVCLSPDHHQDLLDDFCSQFELDELSFEEFQRVGRDLDLRTGLPLTDEDRQRPGSCVVRLSRQIRASSSSVWKRQPFQLDVAWRVSVAVGHTFIFEGKGDQDGDRCGDVYVEVQSMKTGK